MELRRKEKRYGYGRTGAGCPPLVFYVAGGPGHRYSAAFCSRCPEYRGAQQIKHWFEEWNTRGKVLAWDIRGFFHREDRTVVEWYFENKMHDGTAEIFDGLSLIDWDGDDRICRLQEFGCNLHRYDPYADGPAPKFREAPNIWF